MRSTFSRRQWLLAAGQLSAQSKGAPGAEPHFWTLCQTSDQVRKRKTSSEELTRMCLERIRRRNERLNAFITITGDSALKQARSSDRDSERRIVRGPLHGVPIALKDNIDTAGVLTTAASQLFATRVPTEDAEMARRVRQAGAVFLRQAESR